MRVPIPAVILSVILVVAGMWWHGTREKDFLTPPSAEKLILVRSRVASSFPEVDKADDVISEPPTPVEPEKPVTIEPPKPEINLGDLATPPMLTQYGERSPQGAAPMIELAKALEEKGQFQRALLAWERVLDLTKADASQVNAAVSAIRRLRPTLPDWNTDAAKAIPIVIQAGTGKKMAKTLTPILEQAARDIERASAGILTVKANITVGKSSATGASPVALWLAGSTKKPVSTEVLSFTVESPETLHQEVVKTVFVLVRSLMSQKTSYTTPAPLAAQENPLDALNFRITRLCWSEFAASLNLPPKPEETPPKKTQAAPKKPAISPKKP